LDVIQSFPRSAKIDFPKNQSSFLAPTQAANLAPLIVESVSGRGSTALNFYPGCADVQEAAKHPVFNESKERAFLRPSPVATLSASAF
jgi:hypothetical protein